MGAVAALSVFAFATPAVAQQHKEDPIGTGAPVPAEKRELAPQAGPTNGRDVLFYASDENAQLEVRYPSGWRVLCEHPCAARAFIGAAYRVAGDGIVTSRTFSIYPNPGPFVLRANVGSTGARTAGVALTITGALVFLISGGWAATHAVFHDEPPTGVWVVTAGGAVLLTIGIIQLATTGTALSFGPAALYGARGGSAVRPFAGQGGPTSLTVASW